MKMTRALTISLACAAAWVSGHALAQGLRPPGAPGPVVVAPAQPKPVAKNNILQADYIVALVNSEPITNSELRGEVQRIVQQIQQQRATMPSVDELNKQVLERLVNEKVQLQFGRDNGMKIEDLAVDQAELAVARQNQIDVPELRRRVTADGVSPGKFRLQLREQLLLVRLREREVDGRVRVSEAEIDQYIAAKKTNPDPAALELNLAQVLIAVPDSATPAQAVALQDKAQRVLVRARAGEDFATLVREFSDAPDRSNGGQLGLRTADRYPPLFLDATQNLKVGVVAELVKSGAGYHVLKVLERRAVGLPQVMITQNKASHILLRPSPKLDEAGATAKLKEIKALAESGKVDFATLAKENSADGSAPQGGDLGWAGPGLYVPEFEEVLSRLQPGQISEPFLSRFGMHVIKLVERKQVPQTEKEQREVIRATLREKKLEEAYVTWAKDLRGRAYVELREPPL